LPRSGPSEKDALIDWASFSPVRFISVERRAPLPRVGPLAQESHLPPMRIGTLACRLRVLGLPLSLRRPTRLCVACRDALLRRLPRGLAARRRLAACRVPARIAHSSILAGSLGITDTEGCGELDTRQC